MTNDTQDETATGEDEKEDEEADDDDDEEEQVATGDNTLSTFERAKNATFDGT